MAAVSPTRICNMALSWLGASIITSLDIEETSTEWSLCNLNYETIRDAVLEEREWTFAVKRKVLNASSEIEAFGAESSFLIPEDRIRVLTVHDPAALGIGSITDASIHERSQIHGWQIEGKYIIVVADEINIRYIQRILDPNEYSPAFIQAFAQRIAAEFALTLTESKTLADRMWDLYEFKLGKGSVLDAIQGRSRRIRSSALTRRR
ncbi:MAG: hypothetical protein QQN63_11875 [Nitrosopumilus sp.]